MSIKYVNGKKVEWNDPMEGIVHIESIDYGEAVDSKIREKYSVSQEFAILRQKDEKLEEYKEYYNYCEECKKYVKGMLSESNSVTETPDDVEVTE